MNMPLKTLSDVAALSWGNTSLTKQAYLSSGYDAYSASGNDGFVERHEHDGPGVVLSAIGARCGKCFYADGKWTAIKNTITITPKPSVQTDFKYLYYLLNRPNTWPSRGGGQPFIGLGVARDLRVPVPKVDEQKRIAAILDKADELRAKRRQAIAKLDELLQATFLDMFGNGEPSAAQSSIGALEDIVGTVVDCPHSTPKYSATETGFPCVRSPDIQEGDLDLINARRVAPAVYEDRVARHIPKAGEIIYTREGGRLGNAAQIPQDARICLGQRMMLLAAKEGVSTNEYIWALLNSHVVRRQVKSLTAGAAAPRINISDIRKLTVPIPSYELQSRFSDVVGRIRRQKSILVKTGDRLLELFSSIQQRAFKGEL